jgi:hypothetical protein
MRWYRERNTDEGYSLIEVVVASAIIFVVAIGVVSALGFSTMSSQMAAMRGRATNFANEVIESARNMPYDALGTVTPQGVAGDPPGPLLSSETTQGFLIERRVWWARNPSTHRAMYKDVSVTVSWTKPVAGRVTLATSVLGRTAVANAGDVEITVREYDSPNDAIMGAQVRITPQLYAARQVSTDETGVAFFGFVPAGSAALGVTATGYIFDLSPVNPIIVTDNLCTAEVLGQHPSTLNVHVRRSSGPVAATPVVATLNATDTVTYAGTTDAEGVASFPDLLIGSYTISSGGLSKTISLEAPTGQTHDEYIDLFDPSSIRIHVTDGANNIAGATVSLSGPSTSKSAVTDAAGLAIFSVDTTGTFNFNAVRIGYASGGGTVAVTAPAGAYTGSVALQGIGTITVHAIKSGTPTSALDSVIITVTGPSPSTTARTLSTGADGTGAASFTSVPIGTYTIGASLSGYTVNTAMPITQVVAAGGSYAVYVTLTKNAVAGKGTIQVTTYESNWDHNRWNYSAASRHFYIRDAANNFIANDLTSGDNGAYTLSNVTEGTYYGYIRSHSETLITIVVVANTTTQAHLYDHGSGP